MAVVAGIYFLLMQWSYLPLAEFETLLENFAGDAEMDSH